MTLTDLQLEIGDDGADLLLAAGDLATDPSLVTAVVVSLFTDARAADEDTLPEDDDGFGVTGVTGGDVQPSGFPDRRGWWSDTEVDRFGSRLWLLARSKATPQVAAQAREFALEALRWLIEHRVASKVEVQAELSTRGFLYLTVTVHRGASSRWASAWDQEAIDAAVELAGVRLRVLTR